MITFLPSSYRRIAAGCLLLAAVLSGVDRASAALMPGTILIADHDLQAIYSVDPDTGVFYTISDADDNGIAFGSGPGFSRPQGMALDADGNLLVADSGLGVVFKVDPQTGNRSILSGNGVGSGDAFDAPQDIIFDASGRLLVSDSFGPVFVVDAETGDRTVLSRSLGGIATQNVGEGRLLITPVELAVDQTGIIYAGDVDFPGVLSIDPITGDRVLLLGRGNIQDDDILTPNGDSLLTPNGLVIDSSGNLLIADNFSDSIFSLDPITGAVTVVSGQGVGVGVDLSIVFDLEIDAEGNLLVLDASLNALVSIDPLTGDRSLLIDLPRSSNDPFFQGPMRVFVTPNSAVPEPGSLAMGLLACFGWSSRRRRTP